MLDEQTTETRLDFGAGSQRDRTCAA